MEQDNARPVRKRRAAQACKSCRTRKVRCDLVATGFPPGCTNCKLDGITCELMGNKRRKTIHVPPSPDHNATSPTVHEVKPDEQPLSHTHDDTLSSAVLVVHESTPLPNGAQVKHTDTSADAAFALYSLAQPINPLPSYIQRLPSSLSSEDLAFLSTKGALSLPTRNHLRIILCRYVEFVHPLLPLIDLNDTLKIINDERGSSGCISMILLAAMIYAALPFVELKHVRSMGYSSKLEARTATYKRVKLLYDLGTEADTMALIQVALLTSTPHGSMDAIQDAWYWIGLALSHAHSIGLHLDIGHANHKDSKRKLRRRLWWCCYVREHVVAMGLGRPSRITYFDVPMLSISDFELCALVDNCYLIPSQCPVARDVDIQQQLAVISIEKAKLCVCVGRAVSIMCAIRDHASSSSAKNLSKTYAEAATCAKELETWVTILAIEATYDSNSVSTYNLHNRGLIVAQASLHMVYYDTICLLNRPLALANNPSEITDGRIPAEEARGMIRWAARELVRINDSLHGLGLLSYLDATSVANVVAAIVVNLLDVKSTTESIKTSAIEALRRCADFLRVLKVTYGSATHAYRFLEATLKSDGFPARADSGSNGYLPRNRMQSIDQLSSIFSPEEVANSPSLASFTGNSTGLTPTGQSLGIQSDSHAFSDEFGMDEWLHGEDQWPMPNFGTMDLSASFAI